MADKYKNKVPKKVYDALLRVEERPYIEKAKAREGQHSQERSQVVPNIHDESMRRRSEDIYRSQELTAAMNRGTQKVKENESRNTANAFMDRNKRLLDKGIDAVKRKQSKTYFR